MKSPPQAPSWTDTTCGCATLLLEYIAAGNETVDLRLRKVSSQERERAVEKQSAARARLVQYDCDRRYHAHCPNRIAKARTS